MILCNPTQPIHLEGKACKADTRFCNNYVKRRATLAKPFQGLYSQDMSVLKIQPKNSPHPGSFVKIEIIDPLGLSVKEAASVLGITRQALSTFLNGQAFCLQKWPSASPRPLAFPQKNSCECKTLSTSPRQKRGQGRLVSNLISLAWNNQANQVWLKGVKGTR